MKEKCELLHLQVRPHAPPNIAVPVPPEDDTFGKPLQLEPEGNGTNDRPARDEMVCIFSYDMLIVLKNWFFSSEWPGSIIAN